MVRPCPGHPESPWRRGRNKGNSPDKQSSRQGLETQTYPGGGWWRENLADQPDTVFHLSQRKISRFQILALERSYAVFCGKIKRPWTEGAFSLRSLSTREDPSGMQVLGSCLVGFSHPWGCLRRKPLPGRHRKQPFSINCTDLFTVIASHGPQTSTVRDIQL